MRIGFIQPGEEDSPATELGYAEAAAANEEDEDGSWLEWSWRVFINFLIVYGFIAFGRDLIDYLRAW